MCTSVESFTVKSIINSIVSPIRGIKPMFEEYHVIRTLMLLHVKEPLGRHLLSKNLGLSLTSTRTLIKRLKAMKLINVDLVGGCSLTEHGRKIAERILDVIGGPIDVTELLDSFILLYRKAFAYVLKRCMNIIECYGVANVRDTIIRHGAKAAILIYVIDNRAFIPPYKEFNEDSIPSLRRIKELIRAEDHDVIMVIFSDSERTSERICFHTLLELNIL